MSRLSRLGVINNPRSRQNLRGMAGVRAVLERHPEVLHRELSCRADTAAAIRDFADAGVEIVVVNGGDGTVQGVLSEIINSGLFAALPQLAVLPAGMTNLIAADVGLGAPPDRALDRLIAAVAADDALHQQRRHVISMHHAADQPPAHGLFFGTGAFYRGTMLSREQVHRLGVQKSLAAGLGIAWFLLRALLGRGGRSPLYRGEKMTVQVDGVALPGDEQFFLLGTSLERLILGAMPFWGEGAGGLRYTGVGFPPRRFARALVPLLRGRPRPWMASAGYRSGRTRQLSVQTGCPIVMDGEIFPTSPDLPVVFTAEREIGFVRVSP